MMIYQSLPAPLPTALWLKNLLLPVITACNFETPISLELRPCADWAGLCQSEKYVNDGRAYLNSTRIFFWERKQLIFTYLHECCHRLLGVERGHDPVFFALQYLVFLRVEHLHKMTLTPSFYDIQDVDQDELGLGAAVDWATQAATELAGTATTAEKCAVLLASAYSAHINAWREAPHKAATVQARQRAAQAAALDQLGARLDRAHLVAMAAAAVGLVGWAALILINR
jgi:hypothetical protein